MKINFSLLVLAAFLTACTAAAPTPTLQPTATAVPPTATATPLPTSTPTPAPLGDDPALCKINDFTSREVSVGFPRLTDRMRTTGNVRAAVLFADFEDGPASLTPEDLFGYLDPGAEEYYADLSYGQMQFELVPYLVWLRLPGVSTDYDNTTYDGEGALLQLAADLADADFDFSAFDMIIVLTDPFTSPFAFGPAFTGGDFYGYGGIEVDGVRINNGTVSGQDLNYWGYTWLNHEAGHLMGLADLYLYADPANNMRYIGDWGSMGMINGPGQEFFGWERWQLEWLEDVQIACFPEGGMVTLTAIEVVGGYKLIVVPVSESLAVVVESRRVLGFDDRLPEGGALVYTINTTIPSGEGPLHIQPEGTDLMSAPLAAGESLTVSGVTVTVLASDELTDTIEVSVR